LVLAILDVGLVYPIQEEYTANQTAHLILEGNSLVIGFLYDVYMPHLKLSPHEKEILKLTVEQIQAF
jgi:beta-galactosidase beta subunit